jgi:hypothetical protein
MVNALGAAAKDGEVLGIVRAFRTPMIILYGLFVVMFFPLGSTSH